MNWALLAVVAITEVLALTLDAFLGQSIFEGDRSRYIGGLQGTWLAIWRVTFVISSIGIISSFLLHLLYSQDWIIVCIFASMNVAHIVFDAALINNSTYSVFASLIILLLSYTTLFVYTIITFPTLVLVHMCNSVGIFHGLVLDCIVWQRGWWIQT
jgi:hypothetical protein